MTTPTPVGFGGQATPHTPWDNEIEAMEISSNGPTLAQSEELRTLHCLQDGYLECYTTLVEPLLEATKEAQAVMHATHTGPVAECEWEYCFNIRVAIKLVHPPKLGAGVAKEGAA